jgi:hypothetical protein
MEEYFYDEFKCCFGRPVKVVVAVPQLVKIDKIFSVK